MRANNRFFGDSLNKDRKTKNSQTKSLKIAKEIEDDLTPQEYDMLVELIKNPEGVSWESRSYMRLVYLDKWDVYCVDYSFTCNNMPNAIKNKLSRLKSNHPKNDYHADSNTFGVTTTLFGGAEIEGDKGEFVNIIKEILDIIKSNYNDIISFYDDYKDKELLRMRNTK